MTRRMSSRLGDVVMVLLCGLVFLFLGSVWWEWSNVGGGAGAGAAGPEEAASGPVRVEVLNGMGESGAARRASERLREMGFDVVYYGNADDFDHDTTRILDRSARPGGAARVGDSLGLERVLERPKPELHLDATLILGEDWRRYFPGAGG